MDIKSLILDVKDFPKPGIVFKDITPVVQSAAAYNQVIDDLAAWAKTKSPTIIAGIESRGFIFAAGVARELRLGLTLIRKKGKLPRASIRVEAPNEYALEHFEMHEDGIVPGDRVLIVDDLIATGSSSTSAIHLIKALKGDIVGFAAAVELSYLHGIENIKKAHPLVDVFALIRF